MSTVLNTESVSASENVDFISIVNNSIVLPSHSNKEVFITIIDDIESENQESFLVTASKVDMESGMMIIVDTVDINIFDNDGIDILLIIKLQILMIMIISMVVVVIMIMMMLLLKKKKKRRRR